VAHRVDARRLTEIDFPGGGHTMASGSTSPYLSEHPIFIHASDAVQTLGASDDRLANLTSGLHLRSSTAHQRTFRRRTARSRAARRLLRRSVLHHGSQICALRDLYARH